MDTRAEKLWQRGIVHLRQGNLEAAQASFESFLGREPGSSQGRLQLSLVYAQQGRNLAAIAVATQALAEAPDSVELLAHLASCHLGAGHPELARSLATRAVALPRGDADVIDLLAVVFARLDEQALAIRLFDEAIRLDPGKSARHFKRGVAHRQFGQLEAAERDFETCIALSPRHAAARWNLSVLRAQYLASNHVGALRERLADATCTRSERELVLLALFKELDDLADPSAAWPMLAEAIAGRPPARGAAFDPSVAMANAVAPALAPSHGAPAVFIFGMPGSGVMLLGNLLSRHGNVLHLGRQQVFARLLSEQLGRDSIDDLDDHDLAKCASLDFEQLGQRYLANVTASGGKPLLVCESRPSNFKLAGFIARALPGARLLHMVRDPLDTCVSVLANAFVEHDLPRRDPAALGRYYLQYHRLMQHWHALLPGQMMDVDYESLVEKPEMVLRVICSFLGIRYASSMRSGLQLHQRGVGRGQRYGPHLHELQSILASMHAGSRST